MALGPLTIFDKSFLQSLTTEESVWFDNFFRTVITPLFFVETLADLEKEVSKGKTPEDIVGLIAFKTPEMNSMPNVHHFNLSVSNLLGYPVELGSRPIISGGVPKQTEEGYSLFFKEFPEYEALSRWQKGEFLETERNFAKEWRKALANPEFETFISMAKNTIPKGKRFSNTAQIKEFVDDYLSTTKIDHFYLLFEMLGVPKRAREESISRWKKNGRRNLSEFAPYAHYVFSVDLFFYIALATGHISKERASNKVDIAYLYYLPFSHVMVSNDKLHKNTAPLFMKGKQQFICGYEIKPDLSKLNQYYELLPQEVKDQGIIRFATYPPQNLPTKIAEIWDIHLPIWRRHDDEDKKNSFLQTTSDQKLLDKLKYLESAPAMKGFGWISSDEANAVTISRRIHARKGKWRTVPKSVVDAVNKKK